MTKQLHYSSKDMERLNRILDVSNNRNDITKTLKEFSEECGTVTSNNIHKLKNNKRKDGSWLCRLLELLLSEYSRYMDWNEGFDFEPPKHLNRIDDIMNCTNYFSNLWIHDYDSDGTITMYYWNRYRLIGSASFNDTMLKLSKDAPNYLMHYNTKNKKWIYKKMDYHDLSIAITKKVDENRSVIYDRDYTVPIQRGEFQSDIIFLAQSGDFKVRLFDKARNGISNVKKSKRGASMDDAHRKTYIVTIIQRIILGISPSRREELWDHLSNIITIRRPEDYDIENRNEMNDVELCDTYIKLLDEDISSCLRRRAYGEEGLLSFVNNIRNVIYKMNLYHIA